MVKSKLKKKKPVRKKVKKRVVKKRRISKKRITNRRYIHGDFDRDGIKNIDDKYPFNGKRGGRVNKEVSLSDLFIFIEKNRRAATKIAKKIAKRRRMRYRVKDTYSIINKAVRSNKLISNDLIGLRITVNGKRVLAKKLWEKFNKRFKVKVKDNKYKTLKGSKNPYRAYHSNFSIKKLGAEGQFRTKKFGKLNDEMHLAFKQGKSTRPFLKRSKKLIKRGY